MIVGMGIDLVEISRIAESIARWGGRFEKKLFTERERAYCNGRAHQAQHFAARFAAKEATLKALRVPPGLSWHEMEVEAGGKAPPRLVLSGVAAQAAAKLGVRETHLSLTHAADLAAAVVVLES